MDNDEILATLEMGRRIVGDSASEAKFAAAITARKQGRPVPYEDYLLAVAENLLDDGDDPE